MWVRLRSVERTIRFRRSVSLEQFSQGLKDAGHTNEVVDLYAMKFDPVLKLPDYANWIDETTPIETLKAMIHSSSNRIEWFFAQRWLRNKDISDVVKLVRKFRPRDVVEQQEKIAGAQECRTCLLLFCR